MRKHGAAERVFNHLARERVAQAYQRGDEDTEVQNAVHEYMAFEAYMVRVGGVKGCGWSQREWVESDEVGRVKSGWSQRVWVESQDFITSIAWNRIETCDFFSSHGLVFCSLVFLCSPSCSHSHPSRMHTTHTRSGFRDSIERRLAEDTRQ